MQFLFGVWVLPEAYVRGFLGDDFQIYSRIQLRLVRQWMHVLRCLVWFCGPLYLAATCSVLVLPEECGGRFFCETIAGFFPVFSAFWFDSGYMCLSVYGGVGLAGCDAPRAVFLRGFSGPDALHHGWYGPAGAVCGAVQNTAESPQLHFIYGRRHSFRVMTSLCFRIQRNSWSSVVHVLRQSSDLVFRFFYVNKWITDPEVDVFRPPRICQSLVRGVA